MKRQTRHEQRTIAFQLLFETEFRRGDSPDDIYQTALDNREFKDTEFIRQLYFGTVNRIAEFDEMINAHSQNWKTARMNKVTLSILRMGTFELTARTAPPKVIINEEIELVKEFGDEDGFTIVNGILNSIARSTETLAADL